MKPRVLILTSCRDELEELRRQLTARGCVVRFEGDEEDPGSARWQMVLADLWPAPTNALARYRMLLTGPLSENIPVVGLIPPDYEEETGTWGLSERLPRRLPAEDLVSAICRLLPSPMQVSQPVRIDDPADMIRRLEDALSGPLALASSVAYVTERMNDDLSDAELQNLVRDAGMETDRIARIVGDLDAIEAIRDGRFQQIYEQDVDTVDVIQVLRSVTRAHQQTCDDLGVQVVMVTPDEPLRVTGNSEFVRQLVDRLLIVAVEDSESAAQVVELRLEPSRERVSVALVRPPRATTTPTTDAALRQTAVAPPGRDLALAVIRSLAEVHGGSFAITFKAGGPTSYVVTLPG